MNVCFTVNFELPCDPHHLRQLATTTSKFIRYQLYLKKEVLPEVYKVRLISSPHEEIFGVFQEVSMQQWARPNRPRANKMFAGP